jgi:DNA-binding transcriptional LysR family regulator
MEIRTLKQFIAVAEELHFGRAAERLHMSQPPLSYAIKRLEQELRVKLFERDKKHVAITPAGRIFLERAYSVLEQLQIAVEDVQAAEQGAIGRLVVGYTDEYEMRILPETVARFAGLYPHVTVQLFHHMTEVLQQKIANRELDLAFVNLPLANKFKQLASRSLGRVRFLVALKRTHPLAEHQEVYVHQLKGEQLLGVPQTPLRGFDHQLISLLGTVEATRHSEYSTASTNFQISLAREGQGVALLAEGSFAEREWPELVFRPLADPNAYLDQAVIWRQGTPLIAVQRFVELAVQNSQSKAL